MAFKTIKLRLPMDRALIEKKRHQGQSPVAPLDLENSRKEEPVQELQQPLKKEKQEQLSGVIKT